MAPGLGKRKRVSRAELEQPSRSPSPEEVESSDEDIQERFRRAFEAKFKPLEVERKKVKVEKPVEDDSVESEFSGLSDDESDINDADQVEVVEYKAPAQLEDEDDARQKKRAFMSSKPPKSDEPTTTGKPSKKKTEAADDDSTDASNLKHDLALQKLLRESHLLSSASNSGTSTPTSLTTSGIARHKSTDLHLQALGAKASVFTQKKMPMAQRKHQVAKAKSNEEKRRAEAREAGIILEREQRAGKNDADKKRERGVGGPSIGKFRGGTLSLSREDVRSITGGGGGRGGAKGRGRGRGRGGRR